MGNAFRHTEFRVTHGWIVIHIPTAQYITQYMRTFLFCLAPVPLMLFDRIRNSMKFCNALVYNIFNRSQRNYAHVNTVDVGKSHQ